MSGAPWWEEPSLPLMAWLPASLSYSGGDGGHNQDKTTNSGLHWAQANTKCFMHISPSSLNHPRSRTVVIPTSQVRKQA